MKFKLVESLVENLPSFDVLDEGKNSAENRRLKNRFRNITGIELQPGSTVHHLDSVRDDLDHVLIISSNTLDADLVHKIIHAAQRHNVSDIQNIINNIKIYKYDSYTNECKSLSIQDAIDLSINANSPQSDVEQE